jgi:hypothetical protein
VFQIVNQRPGFQRSDRHKKATRSTNVPQINALLVASLVNDEQLHIKMHNVADTATAMSLRVSNGVVLSDEFLAMILAKVLFVNALTLFGGEKMDNSSSRTIVL